MWRVPTILIAIVLGLVMGTGDAARADQKDPRLEALFQELRVVTGYLKARTLEQQIWEIWTASGNPEVNRLMDDGVTALATQDYKKALSDFTRIIDLAPDFAEGWNKRATVLYLVGDYDGSLADVDQTLALEPRHFGALSGLGLIKAAQEREEEAIDAFEKALAVNPHMPGVISNIEHLKQRLKDKQI
jgi:tetratricopeptide (TPR) repeat protein